MPPEIPELDLTAHHEAGHAVACVVERVGFRRVSVRPSDEALGHALMVHWGAQKAGRGADVRPELWRARIEKQALIALAGGEAERKRLGRYNAGLERDYQNAVRMLDWLSGSPEESAAYLQLVKVRARDFVSVPVHWQMIRRVAAALLDAGELSSKNVKRICDDVFASPHDEAADA